MGRDNRIFTALAVLLMAVLISGCGGSKEIEAKVDVSNTSGRSAEPIVLEPVAEGTDVIGEDYYSIDVSKASEGYIVVKYTGDNDEVRLQVLAPDGTTYTHVIKKGEAVYSLSGGSGNYKFTGFEAVLPEQYATTFSLDMSIAIENEMGAYLYPNRYVYFTKDSNCVSQAKTLASGCSCDLEVVTSVYKYVTENIEYDHEKAETVEKGYIPDPDTTLSEKKGICLDYASLMAAMLRAENIPTRLEVGYAGDAYHAWISTYTADEGWISGVIQFDGTSWTLMDPTFAANSSSKDMESLIGKGNYYTTKYYY